jgi:hypothetical protein
MPSLVEDPLHPFGSNTGPSFFLGLDVLICEKVGARSPVHQDHERGGWQ